MNPLILLITPVRIQPKAPHASRESLRCLAGCIHARTLTDEQREAILSKRDIDGWLRLRPTLRTVGETPEEPRDALRY